MPETVPTTVVQLLDATDRRARNRVAISEATSDAHTTSTKAAQSAPLGSAAIAQKTLEPARQAHVLPRLRPMQPPREALLTLQSWEGVVLAVDDDVFTARIADMANKTPDEEVEIPIAELSPFDIELLEPGAIFYWSIGYRQRLPQGTRERVSRIRFRRLPAWSRSDLRRARGRAEDLRAEFGWI